MTTEAVWALVAGAAFGSMTVSLFRIGTQLFRVNLKLDHLIEAIYDTRR